MSDSNIMMKNYNKDEKLKNQFRYVKAKAMEYVNMCDYVKFLIWRY